MSFKGPQIIVIEDGALSELETLMKDYANPICVTDDLIHSEYSQRLENAIGKPCRWLMASTYRANTNTVLGNVDIVLGFGGGSSLDVAKLISRDTGINWISIPTAASHDGIASEVASVSHNGYKYSEKCKSPLAVIADTSIISKAPPRLALAGLGDIICKTSSLAEWKLAHEVKNELFDDEAYTIVKKALESVFVSDSLETLISAEIDAGRAMSIFGSSRPCSGTEHAISHAMDRSSAELHGLQVAFATPICLHYLLEAGCTDYKPGEILSFMLERQMPTTLSEMKISPEQFIDSIHHGLNIMEKRNRYSVLKHLDVDDNSLRSAMADLGY
ncbi:MAG: iron-containing alcohol dehydrogenase [Candidatus Thorarchaeota archaeon]|nr:iron-containing alcohol dehydrogenase [Candidatus Thorarchaeota archaeon]